MGMLNGVLSSPLALAHALPPQVDSVVIHAVQY